MKVHMLRLGHSGTKLVLTRIIELPIDADWNRTLLNLAVAAIRLYGFKLTIISFAAAVAPDIACLVTMDLGFDPNGSGSGGKCGNMVVKQGLC